MAGITFEWDERKNSSNKKKHGVSFEEAATVFSDENALVIPDSEHSHRENRFVILGLSAALRMLVVCYCYRQAADVIRIVLARKATRKERLQYEHRWYQ
jgi:uncharacterized DUF497 family protein